MSMNKDKILKVILVVIMLLLLIYVIKNNNNVKYENDSAYTIEETIKANDFLTKDSLIVLFYILLIFLFRKSLNVANPNIKAFGRVSLMIVSAYFTYLSFVTMQLPAFIAIIGGGGFVIGVVEASTNWKKYRKAKKDGKVDRIVRFYLFVTILSAFLDISMTFINFVIVEGKSIVTQKMFNEKRKIEQARSDEKALKLISDLTASGNFANARFHSDNYFKSVKSDSVKQGDEYFSGPILTGFVELLGNRTIGRIIVLIFYLLVSCGVTLLMIAFSESDEMSASNDNLLAGGEKKAQVKGASKGASSSASKGASAGKEIGCNVAMKDAILAQLEVQEKKGRVNKSAIAKQMQVIYGKCSRQYVQQVDDERKSRRIGF